jgi:hypothetical protein
LLSFTKKSTPADSDVERLRRKIAELHDRHPRAAVSVEKLIDMLLEADDD